MQRTFLAVLKTTGTYSGGIKMGSSSSGGFGSFVQETFSGAKVPRSGTAVVPGAQQQYEAQLEARRQNILADVRFDESTREQLLNGLKTLDPTAFESLYSATTKDEKLLLDRKNAEKGRKQLLGQPGLRRQTSVLAGVQDQNEAEVAAKRSEKYFGESKKSALLGMSTPRG